MTERPQLPRSRLSSNRPAVGDEPIRWKEYYRERRLPLALFRYIPTWLGLLAVFVGTGYVSLWILCPSGTTCAELMESLRADGLQAVDLIRTFQPNRPALVFVQGLGVLFLAALMVGVRAATAISGERESRTWEALLLTPLSTRELVHGKVRGIVQSALPYLAAYALAAIPLAWLAGPRELQVLLLTLLPAWPIMSVTGAVGINQSARAGDSWRSILATVRLITVGTFLTAVVLNFVIGFLFLVLMGLGDLIGKLADCLPFLNWLGMERRYQRGLYFLVALGSFCILVCWQAGREFLAKAVKWVDDNERTPPKRASFHSCTKR